MNNPMQTGDGVGLVKKAFSGLRDAFSNPDKKDDEKKGRNSHFSDGANYDQILKTARAMAKDKYTYKLAKLDRATASIKPGTKGEIQSGKTMVKGTFSGATPAPSKKPAAEKKPAAAKTAAKPAAKKPMTTKQAAMSVPAAKKPTGKSALKTEPTKTPPPTSVKSRKVK
jgi:hypothetical protein